MIEVEAVGVDDFRQNLKRPYPMRGPGRLKYWLPSVKETPLRFFTARSWPVRSRCRESAVISMRGCAARSAAGHDDDDFRVELAEGLPVQPRGMFASLAGDICTAGELDQFRHPIPCGHEGFDPFDAGDGGALFQDAGFLDDGDDAIFSRSAGLLSAMVGKFEGLCDGADVFPRCPPADWARVK